MGNECEVCNKSEDDTNRRNQVSLKLSDEQKTSQPTHNALPGK
jgi:hypothetical protein